MFGEAGIIIGQILSIAAVVLGFISFQMRSAKGLLAFQIATALAFSAHYFLIGAPTACALNFISVIKLVCYYIRNKRQSTNPIIPIFFSLLILITSILTWDGWYSSFIMVGLFINAIGFALSNVQTIRKLNLIKSPLCLIYNICVFSTGGIIFEAASIVSSIIGLARDRQNAKPDVDK